MSVFIHVEKRGKVNGYVMNCKTSRKKDPKGGKAPPSKKKEGYGGGKTKKKWSKDKVEALQEGHKLHALVPQTLYHYQPTEYFTEKEPSSSTPMRQGIAMGGRRRLDPVLPTIPAMLSSVNVFFTEQFTSHFEDDLKDLDWTPEDEEYNKIEVYPDVVQFPVAPNMVQFGQGEFLEFDEVTRAEYYGSKSGFKKMEPIIFLLWWQLCCPERQAWAQYAWFASGYDIPRPPSFETPSQLLFPREVARDCAVKGRFGNASDSTKSVVYS
uniref:Transp_Tc5_C domain-containing protein n=1 Tax=Caenorhabditis japonica TaxID=281687 RepID=A0A8R1E327_CAEJA